MWIAVERLWISLNSCQETGKKTILLGQITKVPAGYSGTPLIKKLGIDPGMKLFLINNPPDYFDLLGVNIKDQLCKKNETPDLVHLFVKNNTSFEAAMKKLKPIIKK